MTLGYAVLLLIAGHVAGDFYAQTNRVAMGKRGSVKLLVIHCALYSLCMLPFSVCVFSGESIVLAWLVLAAFHALVDCLKGMVEGRGANPLTVFCVDQALHRPSIARRDFFMRGSCGPTF